MDSLARKFSSRGKRLSKRISRPVSIIAERSRHRYPSPPPRSSYYEPERSKLPQPQDFPLEIGYPDPNVRHPQTSLLGCPAEIRNLIYSYLFESPRGRHTRQYLKTIQADRCLTLGMKTVLICRQVYHETRGFLRRTILLTPQYVQPTKYVTMPLAKTRLASVPAGTLKDILRVHDIVVRDYWYNVQTYGALTSNSHPSGEPKAAVLAQLSIDTVWLQICACSTSLYLYHDWHYNVNILCQLLVHAVRPFHAVRRVVLYFCGFDGLSGRSPSSGLTMARRGIKSALEHAVYKDSDTLWWAQRQESNDYPKEADPTQADDGMQSKLGGESWNYKVWLNEKQTGDDVVCVDVEIYDSSQIAEKSCVLI
jgi:hypothetical protein